MKSNKDIINERYPDLVQNWGESAELLSFNQVIELMDLARNNKGTIVDEDGNLIGDEYLLDILHGVYDEIHYLNRVNYGITNERSSVSKENDKLILEFYSKHVK